MNNIKELVVANFATTAQHGAIKNIFSEDELEKMATVKESLTVQNEVKRSVRRKIEYYNLDVIIFVGYRVKSQQGTQFRIWATQVLRDYLLKGYALNQRMNRVENSVEYLVGKANEQYGNFEIKKFSKSHDRFLIIDESKVYHLGASLKDLGKKWFAFSKLDKNSVESILKGINDE